jgi:WD40 repeat protein
MYDDLLSPRLQGGLQRFAKPWWKRRAVRIFRDESSLAANPHLWSSITEALDDSSWFVLLLSEDAASSEWVGKEIQHWVDNKDSDRILPVVTEGEFDWEDGDVAGSSVPPALQGVFSEEPRWVDLRFARGETALDLQNPDFSAAVADIASAIRGIPKDELASEEVRQHRRTVRTAWAAGLGLFVLAVAALVAGVFAIGQRNDAQDNAALAEANALQAQQNAAAEAEARAEAEASAQLAQEQTVIAEEQAAIAQENERVARAEALAAHATAQLDVDPELAVLLASEALAVDARPAAVNAMHTALQQHRTIFQVGVADDTDLTAVGGLSPDGKLLAVASAFSDVLEVWDVDTGERAWSLSTADEPLKILNAGFTIDGADLVALVIGDFTQGNPAPAELRVFDAQTGAPRRVIAAPDCTGTKYFPGVEAPYYDLSQPMVWVRDLDCDFLGTAESEVGLFDPATGTFTPLLDIRALPLSVIGTPTRDEDGKLIAVDDAEGFGGRVVDVASGEIIYEYDGGMATLSADGARLLARSNAENPALELWDIGTDVLLWRAGVAGAEGFPFLTRAWFSADESLVYGTGLDGTVYVLDATTGFQVFQLRGHSGVPREVVMSLDNGRLATFAADSTVRVWDIGGELLSEGPTFATPAPIGGVLYGGVDVAGGRIAAWAGGPDSGGASDWLTIVSDLSGEVELAVSGGSAALSPDGTLLAYRVFETSVPPDAEAPPAARRIGEVRVIEVDTGAVIAEFDAPCNAYLVAGATVATDGCSGRQTHPEWTRNWSLEFSTDAGLLAMTDGADTALTVWEVETGNVVLSDRMPDLGAGIMVFSPDGTLGAALYAAPGGGQATRIYELESFTTVTDFMPTSGGTVGMAFTPDQSSLISITFGWVLRYRDTTDWSISAEVEAHQGQITSIDIIPGGDLVVTTGQDGVRVWNIADRSLHTDLGFDGAGISRARFLDDTRLLLVPVTGPEAIMVTLDPQDLAAAGRARVTRAFSETECLTYDIDPCPATMEDLQSR